MFELGAVRTDTEMHATGFEPVKHEATDLEPVPVGRLGTRAAELATAAPYKKPGTSVPPARMGKAGAVPAAAIMVIGTSPVRRPMVRLRLLAAVSLCMMTLAGCMGGGDGDGETTTSTSSTGEPATGRATAVTITSAPTSAPADAKATVCFAVSGTGRVSHVAIHWDNVTHAAEPGRTFQSYDLGMAFPDNRSSPDPNGYQLQATGARFCTAATMPDSGSIFVVAHAMDTDSSPGDLSAEREIQVLPGQATIEVEDNAYDPPALEVRAGGS
jgi:hypothetical protein